MKKNQLQKSQDIPLGLKMKKDWSKYKTLYFLFIPVLIYYIIFQYGSMFGLIIAFEDYKPRLGFFGSKFVQTVTYIPHFVSVVVVTSILMDLTSRTGDVTTFLSHF